ncbi:hypothetical protein C380_08715 [Acidovorax sp. KKS102]|uniref:hypothetical protein n=1 Tax=Acidovorax sp. KKS102 TaxID=358220 RepID=UPI00028AF24C|nr:hypothetical protein [Acidovorax sp. KKS102]AFU45445.1 hypothetical protein C380_08715 [Acidovorax sp. KKS102]
MTNPDFMVVIDAIFDKLAVRYGHEWLRQWDGVDMAFVKADWAEELSGYANNLEPLRYALRHLPERCPNVGQLKKIANLCPPPVFKALPVPKADEAVVSAQVAKQLELKQALAPKADEKGWARALVTRSEAGEKIPPYSLQCARQALGLEGRQSWQ